MAPTYAADVGQWRDYAEEALRLVDLDPSHRVLDVACGPGTLALLAAKRAAKVDAVDFSPGMIAELEQRAALRRPGKCRWASDGCDGARVRRRELRRGVLPVRVLLLPGSGQGVPGARRACSHPAALR